jgi:hypothetical protein
VCSNCEWEEQLNICDEILDDIDNEWCFKTIEGIREWIMKNEHVTDNQINAIDNILQKIYENNG